MSIGKAVQVARMNMVEVVGQLEGNGADHRLFKEAVRELSASVDMLEEMINGTGGEQYGNDDVENGSK